jgi:hypothetical protein
MAQTPNQATAVLTRLLAPLGRCLTPEVAKALVHLRADPSVQARLEVLAEKNTEGTLTPEERDEYETAVRAIEFIAVLQAKARAMLARHGG